MFQNDKFVTGVDYYHRLNFFFNLLIAVPLVPFSIVYLIGLREPVEVFDLSSEWQWGIDLVSTVSVVWIAFIAYQKYKRGKLGQLGQNLRAKLVGFHTILIDMYLRLTLSAAIVVLAYYLTHSNIHLISFLSILVVFSLKRPSLKMIVEELKLNEDDSSILRNREEILP